MTERERTVAVLKAMDKAAEDLAEVAGFSWAMKHPVERIAWTHMTALRKEADEIIDRFNNDGLPETEPIRPEEWQTKEAA